MHVAFVHTNFMCGGVHRLTSIMANYWVQKGWQVTLLTFGDPSSPPFFELDSRIHSIPLGVNQTSSNFFGDVRNNLRRVLVLRRSIRESMPDVVISFGIIVNVLVLLSTRGLSVPVIIADNDSLMGPIPKAWKLLRLWTNTFVDHIVAQTEMAHSCLHSTIQAKTTVIPNIVAPIPEAGAMSPDLVPAKPSIVAMGRFYRQKGFDLLLRAVAILKDRYPDWTLTIYGDGPLRPQLEALRDGLGLNGRVQFPGLVKRHHRFLQEADLFVLPSRWEGMPIVLAEAMACGLPVIAADCRNGPREVIRDGVDGVLVSPEDAKSLATAMGRLMSDESERIRLASRAVETTDRFALDKVMGMWEELLVTKEFADGAIFRSNRQRTIPSPTVD